MNELFLIIETPRGGDAGHRFLAPPIAPDEATIARIVAAASQTSVGRNYVAVSRTVTQNLQNGTIREGTERIILAGLDVEKVESRLLEKIRSEMNNVFPSLDRLIEKIDWSVGSRSMVVVREELQHWIENEIFHDLPVGRSKLDISEPIPAQQSSSGVSRRLAIGLFTMTCGGCVFWLLWRQVNRKNEAGDRMEPPPTAPISRHLSLAKEWGCSHEQLASSLWRAANWDRRKEGSSLSPERIFADGKVRALLEKFDVHAGINQFLVSPDLESANGLRHLLETQSSQSPNDLRELRKRLYLSWKAFATLQKKAANARGALVHAQEKDKDGISQSIVAIASIEMEVGLGDDFVEPATPLFSRQDTMIYQMLNMVVPVLQDQGFYQEIFRAGVAEIPSSVNDLADFVHFLHINRAAILKAVGNSRGVSYDAVRVTQGIESSENVFQAYRAFENFLQKLSK